MRPMGAADGDGQDGNAIDDGQSHNQDAVQASPVVVRRSKRQYIDVKELLSKPTWSVRSLLPDGDVPPEDEITPEKLHHLLRLSALPLPRNMAHEAKMLKTLHSQLHFVRDIQKVNTDGVEPLRSIRDETEKGIQEITIGMEELKEAFAKEDIIGKNKRPRRRRGGVVNTNGVEDWDVLGSASDTVEMNGARYFVVRKRDGHEGFKGYDYRKEVQKASTAHPVSELGTAEEVKNEEIIDKEKLEKPELQEYKVPEDTMYRNE